jgi:hypothetical protein
MRSPNRRHDVPFFYKYATAATALRIVINRTLRWSSPSLFNDPFDVPQEADLGFTPDQLQDAIVQRFRDYLDGRGAPGTPAAAMLLGLMKQHSRRQSIDAILADFRATMVLTAIPFAINFEALREAWREQLPKLRILCFSEIPDSVLMWSHYTNSHQGVVLQFEISDERDSSFLLAQPVIYRDSLPTLPGVDFWVRAVLGEIGIDWDEFLREYHYVKTPAWAYEKEYRIVSYAKPGDRALFTDELFNAEDLRGLILGARISPSDADALVSAVRRVGPHVRVDRARLDPTSRTVSIDEA